MFDAAPFEPCAEDRLAGRYVTVPDEKASGATFTPPALADFVAEQMLDQVDLPSGLIRVLDPALGDGELLVRLLTRLSPAEQARVVVYGFEIDPKAVDRAGRRMAEAFPAARAHLRLGSFLDFASDGGACADDMFIDRSMSPRFDVIIANPPYVRTQVLGGTEARRLAGAFGLTGRVDLYQAFLVTIARMLAPDGVAGVIVSNRFMTTKGGAGVRAALRSGFALKHVWDLGDTKPFGAAILPAVLVARGAGRREDARPAFTSIYETDAPASSSAADPLAAARMSGTVSIPDGRRFDVKQGLLDAGRSPSDVWRIATSAGDAWLATVAGRTWRSFGDLGKVRVGVKTCADPVFIRADWDALPARLKPEAATLRPLTTHHVAGRFRARSRPERTILYPHETVRGRRQALDLRGFPRASAYLESHGAALRARRYVLEAGRAWYEIWVPQEPAAWVKPKLVFRDICEQPTFWLDFDGTVVNGDCYWMTPADAAATDLLWLAAAVANSTFIEEFYDRSFNNKLYAGRRRFITQYVERFPLPDPSADGASAIIATAKTIFNAAPAVAGPLENELDAMIWRAFGLSAPA